jgi:hypothetical protein
MVMGVGMEFVAEIAAFLATQLKYEGSRIAAPELETISKSL